MDVGYDQSEEVAVTLTLNNVCAPQSKQNPKPKRGVTTSPREYVYPADTLYIVFAPVCECVGLS
jgi:hypothetical protein